MSTISQPPLASLAANVYIEGVYSIVNPQIGTTRAGKPYLKCLVRDSSGEVVARLWSFEEGRLEAVQSTGFVSVAGHTQLYNGQVQLIIEQIEPVEVSDEQLAALLPSTRHDIDAMFGELTRIMRTLKHPAMRALADVYLADDDLMGRFRRAPAAMTVHHAWIGGLLEHTLQLVKLAEAMLPHYPALNRDLVLMGLFLHDLGKTSELAWDRGFDYTTDGNLIGHVVRGVIWLQFKAALAARESGQRLPSDALRVLQHIIISHHGEPEFGAVKPPATPEAVFVSMLDNLDAKTQIALTSARPDIAPADTAEFTDRVWALGTRLYRPDPLAAAAAGSAPADPRPPRPPKRRKSAGRRPPRGPRPERTDKPAKPASAPAPRPATGAPTPTPLPTAPPTPMPASSEPRPASAPEAPPAPAVSPAPPAPAVSPAPPAPAVSPAPPAPAVSPAPPAPAPPAAPAAPAPVSAPAERPPAPAEVTAPADDAAAPADQSTLPFRESSGP